MKSWLGWLAGLLLVIAPSLAEAQSPTGACPAHQWVHAVANNIVAQACAQPTWTDLLGPFAITQAATGTITTPQDGYLAKALNSIIITSDNIDAGGAPGGTRAVAALSIEHNVGGTALISPSGQFISTAMITEFGTSPSSSWDGDIVGSWSYVHSVANVGSNKGALTGSNPQVVNAGTGPYRGIQGEEIDVANLGTANQVTGLDITKTANDTTQGVVGDRAIMISAGTGSSLWGTGIEFGTYNGVFGLSSGASLLKTAAGTITNGIDLSLLTFTGKALKWGSSFLNPDGSLFTAVAAATVSTFTSTGSNNSLIVINNAAGSLNSGLSLQDAGSEKWQVIKNGGNGFTIFDTVGSKNALNITSAGVIALGETGSTGNTLVGTWSFGGGATCTIVGATAHLTIVGGLVTLCN